MISAILLSGGSGSRMGATTPKQYLPLSGKPIALHSFDLLTKCDLISEIIVVCIPSYHHLFPSAQYASPGRRRQDSLFNGLQHTSPASEYILVHDAARPLLEEKELNTLINAALEYGAATLATAVQSTIKQADDDLLVTKTLERSSLYNIQTPQMIKKEILLEGFAKAQQDNLSVTDDVSLAELINAPVKLVLGTGENIKITTPEDLTFAENILSERVVL